MEVFRHLSDVGRPKVNIDEKLKKLDLNRKAHSSPSKSMRRGSDLFGENAQVMHWN